VLGDSDPRLVRDAEAGMPGMQVPLWVAAHRDLAGSPRVEALCAALRAALSRRAAELRG
jgi:hypothetical protein